MCASPGMMACARGPHVDMHMCALHVVTSTRGQSALAGVKHFEGHAMHW